jgi:hypothetical protein
MERRRRPTRVELAVAADSLARRQRLDLDPPLPKPPYRLRVGLHLRVRARAYDQVLGQLVNNVIEIGEDETVPVRSRGRTSENLAGIKGSEQPPTAVQGAGADPEPARVVARVAGRASAAELALLVASSPTR